MDNPWILLIAAALLLCGWVSALIYRRKGRPVAVGFILGLLLAWIGILIALAMPRQGMAPRGSRLGWLGLPLLVLLGVSIALVSGWEAGRALAYDALADGSYQIGEATFGNLRAGFCQGEFKGQGWRCRSGGFPCASVQVACDADAGANCEYQVSMLFSTESGRSFGGDNSEARLVSVPPGETRMVSFHLYRACYHNETVESGRLRVEEPDGGRRTTISFAR
jgi:hypothetical protein